MGNCTSKKSGRLSKLNLSILPTKKMDKEINGNKQADSRGLSTKVAPTTKGQATSFGFKRRTASALPTPVTLTSRVAGMRQDAQSGSSVESLCHVATNTPAVVTPKATSSPATGKSQGRQSSPSPSAISNRFGFRSATPPRARPSPIHVTPKKSPGVRSKSAGPREAREAFFREAMQPAGSTGSVLNDSRVNLSNGTYPGKFWLQTSLLPRPQYPVRFTDKNQKTVTNYCRRDGSLETGSSKDESITDDSGIASQPSNTLGETDTLHGLELSDSSPAPSTRGRVARKLEMRMVNPNKFELLDKNGSSGSGSVPFVKAPRSNMCTGLVQQRTEQFLQRIAGAKDSNRLRASQNTAIVSPCESTESEEEKLKKDLSKSEKSGVPYLLTEGAGENDEMLPGEAMADDITLSFSSDEDFSSVGNLEKIKQTQKRPSSLVKVSGVSIRSDAMKLSNQLKGPNTPVTDQAEDSCFGFLNADEKSALEDTLLELSSESDSLGDKDRGGEKNTNQLNISTDSPGTPSNASLSDGRDFLIDDEIADQPELCFSTHEDVNMEKVISVSGNNNGSEALTYAPAQGLTDTQVNPTERIIRRVSVGTLSPCESLMSDDLMMDFDNSDENSERVRDNCDNLSLEYIEHRGRLDESKKWTSLPRTKHSNGVRPSYTPVSARRRRHDDLHVTISSPASPIPNRKFGSRPRSRSQTSKTNGKLGVGVKSENSSPASHRSGISRASTEDDLSVRLDKTTYHHMFQDIISIKSMLLKLNQVLTDENDTSLLTEEDSAMDLKRQVAFLQQQLQQREKSLQCLSKASDGPPHLCNAATQTDRVRPVSTGPSILQNLPSETNVVTNGTTRKVADWLEDNNKRAVIKVAPADKIMEKVKELSFKPVDVLERERLERHAVTGKNVFKITKIDLVLKSGNYGQSELRKS